MVEDKSALGLQDGGDRRELSLFWSLEKGAAAVAHVRRRRIGFVACRQGRGD